MSAHLKSPKEIRRESTWMGACLRLQVRLRGRILPTPLPSPYPSPSPPPPPPPRPLRGVDFFPFSNTSPGDDSAPSTRNLPPPSRVATPQSLAKLSQGQQPRLSANGHGPVGSGPAPIRPGTMGTMHSRVGSQAAAATSSYRQESLSWLTGRQVAGGQSRDESDDPRATGDSPPPRRPLTPQSSAKLDLIAALKQARRQYAMAIGRAGP